MREPATSVSSRCHSATQVWILRRERGGIFGSCTRGNSAGCLEDEFSAWKTARNAGGTSFDVRLSTYETVLPIVNKVPARSLEKRPLRTSIIVISLAARTAARIPGKNAYRASKCMQTRVTSRHRLATEYLSTRPRGRRGRRRERRRRRRRGTGTIKECTKKKKKTKKKRGGGVCEAGTTPMATGTARWQATVISFPPASSSERTYARRNARALRCCAPLSACMRAVLRGRVEWPPRASAKITPVSRWSRANHPAEGETKREATTEDDLVAGVVDVAGASDGFRASPRAKRRGALVTALACRYRRCILNERQIVAVGRRGVRNTEGGQRRGTGGHSSRDKVPE